MPLTCLFRIYNKFISENNCGSGNAGNQTFFSGKSGNQVNSRKIFREFRELDPPFIPLYILPPIKVQDQTHDAVPEELQDAPRAVDDRPAELSQLAQGPLTHAEHQATVDDTRDAAAPGEFVAAANDRVAARDGEPTGEVTQDYDQQPVDGARQVCIVDFC